MMPRPCQRARLESGLNLNLTWLIRRRVIVPGCRFERPRHILWTNSYTGEQIATAEIVFDLQGAEQGWIGIKVGSLNQRILLVASPRHFGGRQWYFICPYMNRRASVLWMPPGARDFACRQRWGRQVAYSSQFLDRDNRAHKGKARINSRLCSIRGLDPEEWDLPPKPKWMRWSTYNRYVERYDHYEAILDYGCVALVAKLSKKFSV